MLTATAETARPPARRRLADRLSRPVPAASFVAFRIAFGLLATFSQIRFFTRGWVGEFYVAPERHLTYPGLEWIRPLPEPAMSAVVLALAGLGLAIALGTRPRLAAGLFTVGFTYCELIDAALYLNHYWFVTLAGILLTILPAPRAGAVPIVNVWALRAQLAVVYVFAGIAKLNGDWLLRAEPLDTWLSARTDRPLIGPWLDDAWVAFAFSWAGAVFDLSIVGWLLWRRSRPWAYPALVGFHLMTAALFQIGVFPWVMIALTPIFFEPDWPTRMARRLGRGTLQSFPDDAGAPPTTRPVAPWPLAVLTLLAAINLALPLRHYAAEGNVRWNDDGYLLAWRVMLTERTTDVRFEITDLTTGDMWTVRSDAVLDDWQRAAADVRADLILSTAHLIADEAAQWRRVERGDIEVRAEAFVSMNGRLHRRWIDPTVDLAGLSRWTPAASYVLSEDGQ